MFSKDSSVSASGAGPMCGNYVEFRAQIELELSCVSFLISEQEDGIQRT